MLSDEGDRLAGGHTVQDGKTGKGRARPAKPPVAGDFHSLALGTEPRLAQGLSCVTSVGGCTEV